MPKTVLKVFRVLLVGHLLPVTLFAFTVFSASVVVTACSPTRGSQLRESAPNAAQTDLKSNAPAANVQTDLEKKLSGTWNCTNAKDAAVPCFNQSLVFSDSLDKMSENTFISLDNNEGKCHVKIDYTLSVETDKNGSITLDLGAGTLGGVVSDPSNADTCEDDLKDAGIQSLAHHQLLSHSDDWKQVTLSGVTYSRPDPSEAVQAEAWPSP